MMTMSRPQESTACTARQRGLNPADGGHSRRDGRPRQRLAQSHSCRDRGTHPELLRRQPRAAPADPRDVVASVPPVTFSELREHQVLDGIEVELIADLVDGSPLAAALRLAGT
jgi:hypothetical protein